MTYRDLQLKLVSLLPTELIINPLDRLKSIVQNTSRAVKKVSLLSIDGVVIIAALWLSHTHHFGYPESAITVTPFLFSTLISLLIFEKMGVYHWVTQTINGQFIVVLLTACTVSSLLVAAIFFVQNKSVSSTVSWIIDYAAILAVASVGIRAIWYFLSNYHLDYNKIPVAVLCSESEVARLVAYVKTFNDRKAVAWAVKQSDLAGYTLNGVKVLAYKNREILVTQLREMNVRYVVHSNCDSQTNPAIQDLDYLGTQGIQSHCLPMDWYDSSTQSQQVLPIASTSETIDLNKILGRTEVPLNNAFHEKCIKNKNILVTGGGGSIGSELCRQLVLSKPARVVILESCEFNLYSISEKLAQICEVSEIDPTLFVPILGSITEKRILRKIFEEYNIHTVYHAAAYKHVPIVESHPAQGVKVNIFGTKKLLEVALEYSVERFLLISSDKAVFPTNCMGATKRIAELVLQARAKTTSRTIISIVRFGNVLGSSGSVVPKFMDQIQSGGPITLTHRDTTRYFMTVSEAVELVLQASAISKGGEVFVLDMGKPIRILDLATSMIDQYGFTPDGTKQDINIVYSGLRPGEKLHEQLFQFDNPSLTEVPKILSSYEYSMPWHDLSLRLKDIKGSAKQQNDKILRKLLIELACYTHLSENVLSVTGTKEEAHIENENDASLPQPDVA